MKLSSRIPKIAILSLSLAIVLLKNTAYAENEDTKALDLDKGWRTLNLPNKEPNRFEVKEDVLLIDSKESVGFYYKKLLSKQSLKNHQWELSWEWRVLDSSKPVETRIDEGDDRPLAAHLWINQPRSVGWFKGILASAFAIPTPGYMITYSWGGLEEKGSAFQNPHFDEGKGVIKIVRPHNEPKGKWVTEKIHINYEFINTFGEVPKGKLYFVISSDTEDSQGFGLAEVRNVVLKQIENPMADTTAKNSQ